MGERRLFARRIAGRVALSLTSMALVLLVAEFALRKSGGERIVCPSWASEAARLRQEGLPAFPFFNPQLSFDTDLLTPLPDVLTVEGWEAGRFIVYQADENGFKNPPGRYRGGQRLGLFVVGDSFAAARSVELEDAWYHRLGVETGLAAYSAGVGGNGPLQSLAVYERYGVPRRPHFLIWEFYANDFLDVVRTSELCNPHLNQRVPEELREHPLCDDFSTRARIGSHEELKARWLASVPPGPPRRPALRLQEWIEGIAEKRKAVRGYEDYVDRFEVDEAEREIAFLALERALELAHGSGTRMVLTYFPNPRRLFGDDFQASREDNPRRLLLAEFARSRGIAFLDLTDALAVGDPYGHFFWRECLGDHGHLNELGNRVAAEAIASFLKEDPGLSSELAVAVRGSGGASGADRAVPVP